MLRILEDAQVGGARDSRFWPEVRLLLVATNPSLFAGSRLWSIDAGIESLFAQVHCPQWLSSSSPRVFSLPYAIGRPAPPSSA